MSTKRAAVSFGPTSLAGLAFLAGLAMGTVALAGDLVVVKSSLLGVSPGDVLKGEQELSVPAGKTLQLMSQNGKFITLNGPYKGRPDSAAGGGGPAMAAGMTTALSKLLAKNEKYGKDLGATRDVTNAVNRSPWATDVTRSGTFCVVDGRDIQLFRPGSAGSVKVVHPDLAVNQPLAFSADSPLSDWPMDVPLEDGATYQFHSDKGKANITVKLLGREIPDDATGAVALDNAGCTEQALALLNELAGQ